MLQLVNQHRFRLSAPHITKEEAIILLHYHLAMTVGCFEIAGAEVVLEKLRGKEGSEIEELCADFLTRLTALYKSYE